MNVLTYVLTALVVILLGWAGYLHYLVSKVRKQREALLKHDKFDLESILNTHQEKINQHNEDVETLYEIADRLHRMSSQGMQKIAVTRFNPFGSGSESGNTSFALVMLDKSDNGLVISSLQTREGTKIFAKNITAGKSELPLTEEEQRTITMAKQSYKE